MTFAIMSSAEYKAICDSVRAKTGSIELLKSGELAPAILSIELSGTLIALTVITEAGATVVATKGDVSASAVAADGTAVLMLKEAGEWTVQVTIEGETKSATVSVTDYCELTLDYIDPVFANNSWTDIIAACQSNKVPDTWTVGSQKAITIGGTDYLLDIIGREHDDYADGSGKAPLTLQLHELYDTPYPMHSSRANKWPESDMRNKTLPDILALMPPEIQGAIREVNKKTYNGSSVVDTADKLFLLAEREVLGTFASGPGADAIEGSQYEYFAVGNSKPKYLKSGAAKYWWLRSPQKGASTVYCVVYTSTSTQYADAQNYVAFAFCF